MDSNLDQIQLPQLNLPHFEPQLLQKEGKLWIFDVLRKKQLVLTPEEWVRQHWISFLSIQLKFPKGLFALEKGLIYNKLVKRTDLVVWDKTGKPYLLIECKAPKVKLTQKTIEQACMYHKELKCPYLVISNGLQHICLSFDASAEKFTQEKSFPEPPL
ncbi:type I restriction enzyme HsdR N-terminal domain-containing protein [Algoriphagus sp. NG3]|uniref:type I restriction enzyme HsdR N-terminal domain-containing protein n=1 Tax=unclassified Algoriphagus TaxID=2641541 RepID=UPI002A825746|nr:type I restriction enzyme HsdR N-terminal domain-containing protein [Algoriphagus sp. NG3]WPR76423.1 type I restriction enzyme HsdR N-terminal domain-containing protein [Algoriphagus sp. NG3]